MKLIIVAAVLLMVAVASPKAAGPGGMHKVYGAGNVSCGKWLEVRNMRDVRYFQSESFIFGYLTSYNYFVHPKGDIVGKADEEGVMAWIDKHCRDYPLESLAQAAITLVTHLASRK